MEPHTVKCINSFFSKGGAFVGTTIIDNDSTMINRPKQNGREKVEAGLLVVLEVLHKTIQVRKELRPRGTRPGRT
jgi:hypothetical protein